MSAQTQVHPPFRRAAFAAFFQYCERAGVSRRAGRVWLASEMGIDDRYCVIADMDDVECATVVAICNQKVSA